MKFQGPLLVVEDMAVSRRFYEELLNQKVIFDFGENISFESGISLLETETWLRFIQKGHSAIHFQNHSSELYFETEDFDGFLKRLDEFSPQVKLLHETIKHDWQQRDIRFYDPDGHIIEMGESMEYVITGLLKQGKSPEETAKITQHPIEMVLACKDKLKK